MREKNKSSASGIVLYAKPSGITSFSSLWNIKHALSTSKVGHTGTLDSFADGLLVVLVGSLTRLVPHITALNKTYEAVICFGKETDTLEPTGKVIKTMPPVTEERLREVLPRFTGRLTQVPPAYSAVHVNGKRASDVARSGNSVELCARDIFVYKNELLGFKSALADNGFSYAHVRITCSKGTYIRALARDIAYSLGSVAYLVALRRTAVGPFSLQDAVLADKLEPFDIEHAIKNEKNADFFYKGENPKDEDAFSSIKKHFLAFTPPLAKKVGFPCLMLKEQYLSSYLNGRPLKKEMFSFAESASESDSFKKPKDLAVFSKDTSFLGVITQTAGRFSYSFVVKPTFTVFSWSDIERGVFPQEWQKIGTALTVGSFDGMHLGHRALMDSVLDQKELVKGIVTFTSSAQGLFRNEENLMTLRQKLCIAKEKGFSFAIVIDFSIEFSKIEGKAFFETLLSKCAMRYLAEGSDFKCGYKGMFSVQEIALLAKERDFTLKVVPDVQIAQERVSSSRIREAVKKGNLALAKDLLGFPFTFDSSCVEWTVKEGWAFAPFCAGQVFPPLGEYAVDLVLPFSRKKSVCKVDNDGISIENLPLNKKKGEALVAFIP